MQTPLQLCDSINLLANFLAYDQIPDLQNHEPVDCIVLCASAILHQATQVFHALEHRPSLAKRLVLVGGIGHSTNYIYKAVANHPTYNTIADEVVGLPESRVLGKILHRYFDTRKMTSEGCRILIEDKSTNCGANAVETRRVLEKDTSSERPAPKSFIVVQDPTMARRTIASFQQVYQGVSGEATLSSCPIFVPQMRTASGGDDLEYDPDAGVRPDELWEKQRFFELLVGEIPRLKDDQHGYGPRGKGFIAHVDVPKEVEDAARMLAEYSGVRR